MSVGEDVEHHCQVSTLSNFQESLANLSLTSNGEIIHSASDNIQMEAGNDVDKELATNEEQTNPISGKSWAKNKRDTSAKYIEKLEHRHTMFSKKWKKLKKLAQQLASQTGAQLKIIIFNPGNNKTETFHTQNMMKEPGETSRSNLHISAKSIIQAVICYSFAFKRIDII